jgi:hypothetical protein
MRPVLLLTVRVVVLAIGEALERRFPRSRVPRPSQKDVLDTIDDAVLAFAAEVRQIGLDAISFNVCMSWASHLAILEQSRYVEGWRGRTVWATSDIREHKIHRRGFRDTSDAVVGAVAAGFKKVADSMPEARASGFLPLFRVRAQAAFAVKVNIRLIDMVLVRLLSQELKVPYEIQVALGGGMRPPPSEPVFTYQGRRFFEIMIKEKKENNYEKEESTTTR